MKKFSIMILILSVIFFVGCIVLSSPYRELRPYSLFGKNIPNKKNIKTETINGRLVIFVKGNYDTDDFYIDQNLVTIKDYKTCITESACISHHYRERYTNLLNNIIYDFFPVTFVSLEEARTFCNYYGGDLPFAEQWELAAGPSVYPWGDSMPNLSKSNIDGFYQWLTPAGWLPKGSNELGILDLTGNVREWVLDDIPEKTGEKGLKGGGFQDDFSAGKIESFYYHGPTSAGFNRGFRCVYPADLFTYK